jgi:hypothetical protein
MTAELLQRTANTQPLRCLFDIGSDTTLVNVRALPKGAHAKTVTGTNVTGVHGARLLNKEIHLEDIGIPEFSPIRRIPGPVRAKVFNNPDAAYDVIQGMDLLQVLGIDVRCSTKTVTWNNMVIPYRPSNDFDSAATTLTFLANDDPLDESKPPREDTSPLLYFILNMKKWIHILLHNNKSISMMTKNKSWSSFLPSTTSCSLGSLVVIHIVRYTCM